MFADEDPYAILGVSEGATDEQIKVNYRSRINKLHPDKNPDKSKAELKELEEKSKKLNWAYDILSKSDKRTAYDKKRRNAPKPHQSQKPKPKPTPPPPKPPKPPIYDFAVGQAITGFVREFRNPLVIIQVSGGKTLRLQFPQEWDATNYNYLPDEFINVRVLQIDQENQVLLVTHCMIKQRVAISKIKIGQIAEGVVKLVQQNRKNILLNVSGIKGILRFRDTEHIPDVGEKIEVEIIGVDQENLELKVGQIQANEKRKIQKLTIGEITAVTVSSIKKNGVNVRFHGGLRGFIRIEDFEWYPVSKPEEFVTIGKRCNAKILDTCIRESHVLLGFKQLTEVWRKGMIRNLAIGEIRTAVVKNKISSGVVVEIDRGLDALLYNNDLCDCFPGLGRDKLHFRAKVKIKVRGIDYTNLRVNIVPIA